MVIKLKINRILKLVRLPTVIYNHRVSRLCINSDSCINNSIYFSFNNDIDKIKEAIALGAKTIICTSFSLDISSINVVITDNPRKCLANIAKIYYKDISKRINLVGVIGTNGKTTVSTMGYDFFNFINKRSMLIGSNGIFYNNTRSLTNNTTPDIITIYDSIRCAIKHRIDYIFMEVSSVAVDQYRVAGLHFNSLIFTNFSQDHLDYHKSIYEYLFCKLIPFIKVNDNAFVIINSDEEKSKYFTKYCDGKIIKYGLEGKPDIKGVAIHRVVKNVAFYNNNIFFKTNLLGSFNMLNCLSIIGLCKAYKISVLDFKRFLLQYSGVQGRMNQIIYKSNNIWIDYAHTFSATAKVIEEALGLCHNKLYIVIGCGGNREKEKRFMIGSLLNEITAEIILTVDNPRFEEPISIINDIKYNITKDVEVILDRKTAIITALNRLKNDDYLLILGKGCEDYIEIKGIKYPYSDKEVVYDWIRKH